MLNFAASRNSFQPDAVRMPLRLRWKARLGAAMAAQITGTGRALFVSTLDAAYRLDADTGRQAWRLTADERSEGQVNGFRRSAAILGDFVFISDTAGTVYKISPGDGQVISRNHDLEASDEPFCVSGGRLFSKSWARKNSDATPGYSCLDQDLNRIWFAEALGPVSTTSCAVSNRRLVFGDRKGFVHCVDTEEGNTLWSTDIGPSVSVKEVRYEKIRRIPMRLPFIIEDQVILQCGDSTNLLALDMQTGRVNWVHVSNAEFDFIGEVVCLAVDRSYAYYFLRDYVRKVRCLDGSPVLTRDLSSLGLGSSRSLLGLVVGGHYFAGFNRTRKLVAIDVNSGDKVWQYQAEGGISNPPIWLDGSLYFGDDLGYVYRFESS